MFPSPAVYVHLIIMNGCLSHSWYFFCQILEGKRLNTKKKKQNYIIAICCIFRDQLIREKKIYIYIYIKLKWCSSGPSRLSSQWKPASVIYVALCVAARAHTCTHTHCTQTHTLALWCKWVWMRVCVSQLRWLRGKFNHLFQLHTSLLYT